MGDFGLVTYPDKDPSYRARSPVGPIDYMAPEMRRDADKAKPGPADVWALAKTLWVSPVLADWFPGAGKRTGLQRLPASPCESGSRSDSLRNLTACWRRPR